MAKRYTENELRRMGMDEEQIIAVMNTYKYNDEKKMELNEETEVQSSLPVPVESNVVQMHHNVEVHTENKMSLVPTSLEQIASYKAGAVVELPPFADGQPFVARMARPSMLRLVSEGKIPNSLINQATSLFANGAGALNGTGKNATSAADLIKVIKVVVDAALLEPTLDEIHSVGMDLSDDQLMAIFTYTQNGVKALEQFRTK